MATVILSAAGAAIGGSLGGTVLGLSAAAAGRFAGAVIGRSIDQRLLGSGSEVIETGRVQRLRLTGAGEGDAIAQIHGRMRVSGQVIWATEFREEITVEGGGGGKGAPRPPARREFSYSVSVALALCEGEITHVGRVWADGTEIARDSLAMRIYPGSADQLPDPKIEAVEGSGTVPAYRGTAYVVIEDLELGRFGNRVPQFTFEVSRPAQPEEPGAALDPAHGVRAVALLPGSGEYSLATTPVRLNPGPGSVELANVNTPSEKADFATALDNLRGELPACGSVALVVSWFGDDLRCGHCTVRPKVEHAQFDAVNMPWQVAGLSRVDAPLVVRDAEDRPVYGGTPTDASVIEGILALRQAGQEVMYYPFILMDQFEGNVLPDPYSDAGTQAVLPWRGRITTSIAPGRPGSPDGTATAVAEVAAFFGTATAADFGITPVSPVQEEPGDARSLLSYGGAVKQSPVSYHGPDEWGLRRFILHQAALCAAAGGVESFCIGSEMRGLTQIRGPGNSFPAVQQFVDLAAEVRQILGPDVKISYAADWSEYSGHQPRDGSGDRFFHLDSLWADDNIDFVGIDNYMPLSDWRDGMDHADADAGADSIYDLDYLQANIEGGELYDWFYHSPEARAAQIRTPITDGDYGEPWIWRVKDVRNWWENRHHERVDGVRAGQPTAWVPRSKPVRFTEMGCAAVDKGTNQPNKFLDPKSSESALPYHSNGQQDTLVQRQYLRAITGYWTDPANNPVSDVYEGPMLDMDHAHVWAWDARPFPFFPNNDGLWRDGGNYARGHWITGRASARSLAAVIREVAARSGLEAVDTSGLHALVRGYTVTDVEPARAVLQPLMLRYGVDAVERGGSLGFRMRDGLMQQAVPETAMVRMDGDAPIRRIRDGSSELSGRVRLRFVEANADYAVIAEEAILHDDATHAVSSSEMPLVMTRAEGRQVVERWLSEARASGDRVELHLPPSCLDLGPGDILGLEGAGGQGRFRIDNVEQLGHAQRLEAVRIEPESYRPVEIAETPPRLRPFVPPLPVLPFFLDLPLMTGDEVPHAPHVAVSGDKWPGSAAVYSSDSDADYILDQIISNRARVGITETPLAPMAPGRIDRGEGLFLKMVNGTVESVSETAMLNGSNLCAVGDGTPGAWELIQFRDAELVEADTYVLRHRLRGQLGTEVAVPEAGWPAGSWVVMMDGTPTQIALKAAQRGRARHYRIGPAGRPLDDPSYSHAVMAFDGIGLRPLSPVHMRAAPDPAGNLHLTWIRRTRIDGDPWNTPEVPLGEETESYLVRVVQGNVILREATVNGPQWTYGATARAQDDLDGAYELRVAQISARFGPGAFAVLPLEG